MKFIDKALKSLNSGAVSSSTEMVDEEIETVVQAVSLQSKIATDLERPLEERLLAYEDIIDSQVGDTSLVRARNIEREVGLRQIYLKFEGGNPTGTQKDRIAFAQVLDALRRGFDTISVATCGSYGVASALAASMAGLKCIVYIPTAYHSNRIKEMTDLGAEIRRIPGDYEQAVVVSHEYCSKKGVYDANPGGDNINIQFNGYGQIANEIYDELRDAPAVVAVSVSNGTTLTGIYKGFLSLYRRGKISRMPRIVAGSSYNKNPIIAPTDNWWENEAVFNCAATRVRSATATFTAAIMCAGSSNAALAPASPITETLNACRTRLSMSATLGWLTQYPTRTPASP